MEYHKINGLYKRDKKGNFTGEFSQTEFMYLYESEWWAYEKVDGTNVRLYANGTIGGRTNKAQFSLDQVEFLKEQRRLVEFSPHELPDEAVVYGEMYGAKIQSGGHYRPDLGFVLFDVWLGSRFMTQKERLEYAQETGFETAPLLGLSSLSNWEAWCREGKFASSALKCGGRSEGYVLTPYVDLRDLYGHRVITKLKFKDFDVS